MAFLEDILAEVQRRASGGQAPGGAGASGSWTPKPYSEQSADYWDKEGRLGGVAVGAGAVKDLAVDAFNKYKGPIRQELFGRDPEFVPGATAPQPAPVAPQSPLGYAGIQALSSGNVDTYGAPQQQPQQQPLEEYQIPEDIASQQPLQLSDQFKPATDLEADTARLQADANIAARPQEAVQAPAAPDYMQKALAELGLGNEGTQKLMQLDAGRRLHSRDTQFNRRYDAQQSAIQSKINQFQARDDLKAAKEAKKIDKEAERDLTRDQIAAQREGNELKYQAEILKLKSADKIADADRKNLSDSANEDRELDREVKLYEKRLASSKNLDTAINSVAKIKKMTKADTEKYKGSIRSFMLARNEPDPKTRREQKKRRTEFFAELPKESYDALLLELADISLGGGSIDDHIQSYFTQTLQDKTL